MPLVRIDIGNHVPAAHIERISEAIHAALVAIAGVAVDDRFHIVTRHAADELIFPPGGFRGARYSRDILFIQIVWAKGRSEEVKRQLFAQIVEGVTAGVPMVPDDVWISLVESSRADWSFGSGRMLDPI